jgi:hypothetical protein
MVKKIDSDSHNYKSNESVGIEKYKRIRQTTKNVIVYGK